MIKVGITGGIGTGKSLISKVFSILGAPVFYADQVAKDLIHTDLAIKHALIEIFGEETYLDNGSYNRTYVAGQVFKDKNKLNELNAVVHPAVKLAYEAWLQEHKNAPYTIKEAALIAENHGLDKVIVVSSPLTLRLARLKKRDTHRTEEGILEIIKNQKSEADFRAFADFEVQNSDEIPLMPQILAIDKAFNGTNA
jgi:dephospho-CoA kinase